MSHPSSNLHDRLSPMPMICPLVKLGRSSPPIADQGYHTALETQVSHLALNDSTDDYSLHKSNPESSNNYHCENPYPNHPTKKHLYLDLYSSRQNDLENRQRAAEHYQHRGGHLGPEYESRKSVRDLYTPGISYGQNRIDLCPHQLSHEQQYCPICDQSSNHSSSSLDCEQNCQQKLAYYRNPVDYYQNKTVVELSSSNNRYWNQSSDQYQSEAMCRYSVISQDLYNDSAANKPLTSSPMLYSCNYLVDNFSKLGKSSPSLDQGYHTLVSPNSGPANPWAEGNLNDNQLKGKRAHSKNNSFDKLPDDVILKIFSWLHSYELSLCARVCRRFEALAWTPVLWRTITLYGEQISGDKAIRGVLRQLCGQGRTGACPSIEKVYLSDGVKLSDRGLMLLSKRCPELTHLQTHGCTDITNQALSEFVTRCSNLQHLDITGCINVSCISVIPGPEPRRLFLQYLDLTDCAGIEDNGLRIIVRNCPQLVYLYLRRCIQITDAGLKHVPSFCLGLRELSVSDCSKVTDFGLYELAKLGATLRYLSVAKCDQVSDAGLKVIARRCYKLRYLNARGCEAVSDDAITVLARSCTRLRALDIGKCDVSDAGLRALAESCPNIKKLSLRNCDLVTDRGVQCIAYYCRGLQQLNIQDCQISLEGYRAVKKYCKRCIIEHTNPGFF